MMRRLHDSVYRAVSAARGDLRPVEVRALTLIAQEPGMTVAELRDGLMVGRTRIWQIVARLEWLGVLQRNGAPPRRLGARQPSLRNVSEMLSPDVPGPMHAQHQALNTMVVLEHLAQAPRSGRELAEATGTAERTIRRLLARLEHDGYIAATAPRDQRGRLYALGPAGHDLGRTLWAAKRLES